jgi:hypothetical protein
VKQFDYDQYQEYPSLIFLFKKLNKENLKGRKTASRFVDKYNVYLRRIYDSDMTPEVKQEFYCFIKKEFKERLADIRNLDKDDLNNLNGFIMGRWREYMGYEIRKGK